MSFAERLRAARERDAGRSGRVMLAAGVLVAVWAALLPTLRVVASGPWFVGAVTLAGAILLVGLGARAVRLPAPAVSLIEALVWLVALTAVFVRDTAVLGVVPTPETFTAGRQLVDAAFSEIQLGAAPLDAGPALSLLLVGAVGLVTLILDHVVLTARLPMVAAVGLIAVSLIPAVVVPGPFDVAAFALLAAAILFLVRVETRTRQRGADAASPLSPSRPRPPRQTSTAAVALAIGAVAVVVAVVVTPLLPTPSSRAGAGFGQTGVTIDATLRLGEDLRRPQNIEVLTLRSSAPSAPYLRAATLSSFDGRVWVPDDRQTTPIGTGSGFGSVAVAAGIEVAEYTTRVRITTLQSTWLPVPFPAVAVDGLSTNWAAMPSNRTVVGDTGTTAGLSYEVLTDVPRPTLEQVRELRSQGTLPGDAAAEIPAGLPDIVRSLAREVTAGQSTDYDRLAALQRWFRGSDFTYSLSAPVQQGYDGTGAEAVEQFLRVKAGYCVHFASAFALMARTLGMPSRVVVGYLPGTSTTTMQGGQTVYSVSSAQLHAWPEVYFDGLGWLGFDPTKSLGTPTTFSSASVSPADRLDDEAATRAPTEAATPEPTRAEADNAPVDAGASQAGDRSAPSVLPWGLATTVLAVALAIPWLVGQLRRRRMLAAARAGDAAAAWTGVQHVAIDLGIPVPPSESPRALGVRLAADHGAPPEAMRRLVAAIEHAVYAPADGGRAPGGGGTTAAPAGVARAGAGGASRRAAGDLADDVAAVRASMLDAASVGRRRAALLLPRSLVIRPGSEAAGARRAPA